jgi:asparagine synthase (glutamine-hydrolysing)
MCGFVAIISLDNNFIPLSESIEKMTGEIKHRGPDDEGYLLISSNKPFIYKGDDTPNNINKENISYYPINHINTCSFNAEAAFGFRRLSIQDLSIAGHQPMCYSNRYWIVFNGEIYNFIEIREELELNGYIFKTSTDTEVILAAYEKWGVDCQKKFNGMWAFVIYDLNDNKIFISRDRFGIKPLYYYLSAEKLIIASEIKSILKYNDIDTSPNIEYLKNYIKLGGQEHIKETAFTNIYRFEYACFIESTISQISKSGINEVRYWKIKPNLSNEEYNEAKAVRIAKNYTNLLSDACKIRLRANVSVGAALSGGLDSSSIVYFINSVLEKKDSKNMLESFSCIYNNKNEIDESDYIDLLSSHLKVNSNRIEPDIETIKNDYERMIYILDNPPDDSNMSGWHVFKLVKEKDVTVNLDGQGADEQQGGYLKYIINYFVYLPINKLFLEYKYFSKLPQINNKTLLLALLLNLCIKSFPAKLVQSLLKKLKKSPDLLLPLNEVLVKDMHRSLAKLLHYGDRLSMAHSVESRVPFMDYRLVDFMASIPAVYKLHLGWTKFFSRLSMVNKLPNEIVWRKDKLGFPNAEEYWFTGDLKEWGIRKIQNSKILKELDIKQDENSVISMKEFIKLLNISIWEELFWN